MLFRYSKEIPKKIYGKPEKECCLGILRKSRKAHRAGNNRGAALQQKYFLQNSSKPSNSFSPQLITNHMEQKMKVNVTAAEVGHKTCNCCRRFLKTYHSASAWKNTDDIKDKSETNFQERLCSECLCGSNDWILLQNEASEICIKSWLNLFEWPHINNNISTQRSRYEKGR